MTIFVGWMLEKHCVAKVHAWCLSKGLDKSNLIQDPHVTIIYSKQDSVLGLRNSDKPLRYRQTIVAGSTRSLARFGPTLGALVAHFDSFSAAEERHNYFKDKGVIPTYPNYEAHMSLSYTAKDTLYDSYTQMAKSLLPFDLVFDREVIDVCDK